MFFLSHINSLNVHKPKRASNSNYFCTVCSVASFRSCEGRDFPYGIAALMGPLPILMLIDDCI